MIDVEQVEFHPAMEEIVDVLCSKTQNNDRPFFRLLTAYFMAKMASCMRVNLVTKDRGDIPVNMYCIALSISGYGKGYSVSILESDFLSGFKQTFMNSTMPFFANKALDVMAVDKALQMGTSEDTERKAVESTYNSTGPYPFTFDSGTAPAVKQLRQKLLMSKIGSINLQIDEIGSNLINSTEVLNLFLELYDQGLVKQKLVKNTNDSSRGEDIDGKTPANMLLFGTPVKLLDGGATENAFYSFLETGFARRDLFALGNSNKISTYGNQTPAEIYNSLINPQNNTIIDKWHRAFTLLADASLFNFKIDVDDDVAIELIDYKMHCEALADKLPDTQAILKSELSHRYFKCLKLAGALAFVDHSPILTLEHLGQAMKVVEESGKAFEKILHKDKPYMRVAKYIAAQKEELTHADLAEALPFYQTSIAKRNETITLAKAWGLKNAIIITSRFNDDIELLSGKQLEETDTNKLVVSASTDIANGYQNYILNWDEVKSLTTLAQDNGSPYHWVNHHLHGGHRADADVKEPFNTIVLDIDKGLSVAQAVEILQDYKFILYTTKSSVPGNERFRIIIPTNYKLDLSQEDYRDFINNILASLPFEVDTASNQRCKKWLTNPTAQVVENDGELFDVLPFIPRSKSNQDYQKQAHDIKDMDSLERWFARSMGIGNRNNNMLRYALVLKDAKFSLSEIQDKVRSFNAKLPNPLPDNELDSTIFVTLAKGMELN